MRRSTLFALLTAIALFAANSTTSANTLPPSWYKGGYHYSYSGTLGTTDIDVGTLLSGSPKSGYLVVPELHQGQQWFAWLEVDIPNVIALTSWTGFTPGPQGTQLLGETKLDSDTDSSPFGSGPALVGQVLGDDTISLVICAVVDPNCAYQNGTGSHPAVNFTFNLALQETPIPGALPLFATGLGALGLIGYRRRRKQA